MNRLLSLVILSLVILAASIGITGCTTTTTVQVQRVLGTSTQQLQSDSTYGRKALITLQALREVRADELEIKACFQKPYDRQSNRLTALEDDMQSISVNDFPVLFSLEEQDSEVRNGLSNRVDLLSELDNHIGVIDTNIQVFTSFFTTNDALGLAPRIDWELLKVSLSLDREKEWLEQNFGPNVQILTNGEGKITKQLDIAVILSIEQAVSNLDVVIKPSVDTTIKQGFGDFQTLGVAEINPSDPEYRRILGCGIAQLSPDSFSRSSSDIMGDANVIIVQESPGQFRTYQISNDPSTLMKNISLLVSKATAAAAKYLSGGIAPGPL